MIIVFTECSGYTAFIYQKIVHQCYFLILFVYVLPIDVIEPEPGIKLLVYTAGKIEASTYTCDASMEFSVLYVSCQFGSTG